MQVTWECAAGSVPPNRTVPNYHDGFTHFRWDQVKYAPLTCFNGRCGDTVEFCIPVIILSGRSAVGECILWATMSGIAGNGTYQMRKIGVR